VLVGLLCPIGDTLFATPALAVLRRRFPRAHIDALVYRSNRGMLEGNPDIDDYVLYDPTQASHGLARFAHSVRQVRHARYDLMINLSAAASLIGMLAGVGEQTHLDIPGPWWLTGTRDAAYRQRHAVEHYLRAIAPLLTTPIAVADRQPRVFLARQHRQAARDLLRAAGLTSGTPLIALHAGGDGFRGRKRWSTRRFAAVGQHLVERYGAQVLLLGGKEDIPLAEEVAARMPRGSHVLAGRTSLMETAALIERAMLFIGNDSCPLHIAAALGVPAVGIYGPSSVAQFHPVGAPGSRQRIVHANLPCSPCFHFVGNDAPWAPNLCTSFACLKAISSEEVIAAAVELLRATSEDAAVARIGG
jgi:lipopolysaccharide heptosyltransferase II